MSVRSYCGPPNPCLNILGSLRDTTVDGGLYLYETNDNNNNTITKGQRSSFFGNLFHTGTLRRSNHYSSNSDPITDRSIMISTLLNDKEKRAVLEYVGNESSLLATGVCELLQELNGSWDNPRKGIVCLIKEKTNKLYSVSLLKPSTTKVIWCKTLRRSFQTTKSHSHLVTFEIDCDETEDESSIFGLNFHDSKEADFFHAAVTQQYQSHIDRKPVRIAPARPAQYPSKPIILADDASNAELTDVDQVKLPVKPKKTKSKLYEMFFPRKKKKDAKRKITTEDISPPTEFEHICGAEFSTEEKEAVEILTEHLRFDPNHPHHREVIRKMATENHAAIRASVRKRPEETFSRGTGGFDSARASRMVYKSGTPRERKRTSGNKKHEVLLEEKEHSSSIDEETVEPTFDPIRPDWEKDVAPAIPSYLPQPPPHPEISSPTNDKLTVTNNNNNNNNDNAMKSLAPPSPIRDAPQAPTRTASRNSFVRQNTPPHPSLFVHRDPARPRLPDKDEPIPPHLSYHFTRRASRSPPSSPPPLPYPSPTRVAPPSPSTVNTSTPPPPIPPLPAVLASKSSIAPISVSAPSPPAPPPAHPSPSTSVGANRIASTVKAPPPPPLTGLNLAPKSSLSPVSPSPSPGPSISPDRRSFLDEIQNVDKTKLLRSTHPSIPQKSSEDDGGLMSSIQRMIDSIRPQVGDSDSDSDGDTSTDSDWSE